MTTNKNLPQAAFPASPLLRVIAVDTYTAEQLLDWKEGGDLPEPAFPASTVRRVIAVDTFTADQFKARSGDLQGVQ